MELAVYDLPGGKTQQFDDKAYIKKYFPRQQDKTAGVDPSSLTVADYPRLEHGLNAGIREFEEESHGCGGNVQDITKSVLKTWQIPGGYRSAQGHQSQTVVTLLHKEVDSLAMLGQCRLAFLSENIALFQAYNDWAASHPQAAESEHWNQRPEFSDLRFVTLTSFWKALEESSQQLEAYEKDKNNQPKGALTIMQDCLGRPLIGVIRSWPVYVVYRSGVWKQVQTEIDNIISVLPKPKQGSNATLL
jgi:hypothetical protein